MTGALQQVAALLALRWRMLRSPGGRVALVLSLALVAWLVRLIVLSARVAEPAALSTAVDIAPGAFLGFAVLALVAPLTAGGGHQVVPPDELVAYPVRPSTHFLGGLLLAPVNLVWVIQLLFLIGLTAYITEGGNRALGMTTTVAFVCCVTVVGQALAWLIVGARQSRTGRRIVAGMAAGVVVSAVVLVREGAVGELVREGPTYYVATAVLAGSGEFLSYWWKPTAAVVALTLVGYAAGTSACAWALRRPGDLGPATHTTAVRRRREPATPLSALLATDRSSIWRAPALRRGGLVLVLLPGVIAATLAIPWESLIVLPGLVAAGAGLLFGINAFALDASGSVWLASLPVSHRLLLLSKGLVLTETVLVAVVVAGLAGTVRSGEPPTATQAMAVVGSALACAAIVIAVCLRLSLRRPHRADLRGPRDAVAPPGALAAASLRLAVPCALTGMVIAASAATEVVWFPLLLAAPVMLTAVLSVMRTVRRWDDPLVRARVVQTVASG